MGQEYGDNSNELVVIGDFGAPFGVRGWLKINSYTEPRSNIWNFKDWFIQVSKVCSLNNVKSYNFKVKSDLNYDYDYSDYNQIYRIKESREKFLVLLDGILDRSIAANLTNKQILVKRSDFPSLSVDEYYWVDLLGAKVYNLAGNFLGVLGHVFYNGANDVMVIRSDDNKEYLIPYSLGEFIIDVDLIKKIIKVKWDLD